MSDKIEILGNSPTSGKLYVTPAYTVTAWTPSGPIARYAASMGQAREIAEEMTEDGLDDSPEITTGVRKF